MRNVTQDDAPRTGTNDNEWVGVDFGNEAFVGAAVGAAGRPSPLAPKRLGGVDSGTSPAMGVLKNSPMHPATHQTPLASATRSAAAAAQSDSFLDKNPNKTERRIAEKISRLSTQTDEKERASRVGLISSWHAHCANGKAIPIAP